MLHLWRDILKQINITLIYKPLITGLLGHLVQDAGFYQIPYQIVGYLYFSPILNAAFTIAGFFFHTKGSLALGHHRLSANNLTQQPLTFLLQRQNIRADFIQRAHGLWLVEVAGETDFVPDFNTARGVPGIGGMG